MDNYINLFSQNPWLFYTTVFIISLAVGSFLNVVIYRLPVMLEREWKKDCIEYLELKDQQEQQDNKIFNLAVPASRCPKCGHQIKAWQNIPIISYLILKGKCAHCHTPISARYPLIELFTALLSVIIAWHFGVSQTFLAAWLLTFSLIALSFIDIDHKILPDNIVLPLMWLGLIVNQYQLFTTAEDALWGAIIGYLSLWSIYQLFKLFTGKEGMGYGDFKLLACLGAWLGASQLLSIILIASISGTLLGGIFLLLNQKDKNTTIPFGPYLALGGWLTLIWGNEFMGLILGSPRF